MKRSRSASAASSISGTLRIGHQPRALARRLRKGDVAVIDHPDLDAASAELLADRSPACVINASASVTGRFPSRGAATLAARGIPLVDASDRAVLALTDGDTVTLDVGAADGSATLTAGDATFDGTVVDADAVQRLQADAGPGASMRVPSLAAAALDVLYRDGPALVEGASVPGLELALNDRDVLVVTAGPDFRSQLKALKTAIREIKPVIIVTGDAADVVAADHRLDVIVGPLEAVSDGVLAGAAEVVIHGESLAAASTRLGSLGVRYVASESRLSAEDLAVALAASAGARMITTVGIESSIVGLIDSPRGASAILSRMAAGPAWIDGRMLARLYRSRWSRLQRWLIVGLAAVAVAGALSLHPVVRDAVERVVGL